MILLVIIYTERASTLPVFVLYFVLSKEEVTSLASFLTLSPSSTGVGLVVMPAVALIVLASMSGSHLLSSDIPHKLQRQASRANVLPTPLSPRRRV